jgi:hypothetical protein
LSIEEIGMPGESIISSGRRSISQLSWERTVLCSSCTKLI